VESKTLAAILDMAIGKEIEAQNFYIELYSRMTDPELRQTLQYLANEEKKHEDFLCKYKEGTLGPQSLKGSEAVDYKIAEHLEQPDISANIESKDVYLVAAHRELNSFNFYKGLADIHPQGEVREILLRMANEEMKHKEKVEYLYTNTAFPQTAGG
jgi:rubrerythrin